MAWSCVDSSAGPEPRGNASGSMRNGSHASICPGKSNFAGITPTMVVISLLVRTDSPMTRGSPWNRSCHAR